MSLRAFALAVLASLFFPSIAASCHREQAAGVEHEQLENAL